MPDVPTPSAPRHPRPRRPEPAPGRHALRRRPASSRIPLRPPGRDRAAAPRHRRLRRGVRPVSVVPAYRRGVADRELPADAGLARSIIPPGTAAVARLQPSWPRDPRAHRREVRRLHGLRQRLPGHARSWASSCPSPELATADRGLRRDRSGTAALRAATARSHFADTQKYGEVPARKGLDRGAVRDLRRPRPLQGLRRVRRGLRRARPRRPGHDRQGRRGAVAASRRSSATTATCASSARCRRPRPSTATRRRSPT